MLCLENSHLLVLNTLQYFMSVSHSSSNVYLSSFIYKNCLQMLQKLEVYKMNNLLKSTKYKYTVNSGLLLLLYNLPSSFFLYEFPVNAFSSTFWKDYDSSRELTGPKLF